MADHAIALASDQLGPSPDDNGMIHEDVVVAGTGGTTGAYTTNFVKRPVRVIWLGTYTISGQGVTLNSAALTGVTMARIIGYA